MPLVWISVKEDRSAVVTLFWPCSGRWALHPKY